METGNIYFAMVNLSGPATLASGMIKIITTNHTMTFISTGVTSVAILGSSRRYGVKVRSAIYLKGRDLKETGKYRDY